MSEPLFSQSWYRVASLRPRLRSHVRLYHHIYRGLDWYILQDLSSGKVHRFSTEAYHVIGLMDGKRSMQVVWETACERLGEDMPTQDEVIGLLHQLHSVDALQSGILPDIESLHERHRKEARGRLLTAIKSPLSIKIPLIDPDRFLSSTLFLFRPLFSPLGILLIVLTLAGGGFLALYHWETLTQDTTDRILSGENLVLLWFVYPFVKAIHELGHGYVTKYYGGEVHEMGIMLLVFIPVPYVDASSSAVFRERRRRMSAGGAGILVEILLASLAVCLWTLVEPGAVRAVAFNVMLIAGVSTVLFNGNPLLRFDAYYVLADWLEIPNLGQRSNSYIFYLFKRYILRMKEAESPAYATGEPAWFVLYAISSFVYRIFITIRIIIFLAGRFFFVGVALALWSLISMVIMPLHKMFKTVFTEPLFKRNLSRVALTMGLLLTVVLSLIFFIPAPSFTVTEGVVFVPEDSQVHAGADGFVAKVFKSVGSQVKKGDPLVELDMKKPVADLKSREARLAEYAAKLRLSATTDRTETRVLQEEIVHVEGELSRARERVASLTVRSPDDGILLLPVREEDMIGRFVRNGSPMGYVVDFSDIIVRTVISQDDIERVRHETKAINILPAETPDRSYEGRLIRSVPAATKDLPSLALSLEGGGGIAIDPSNREEPKAFETYFQFDIAVSGLTLNRVGERVYIRFEHAPEPIVYRWYRGGRRLLLRHVGF